MTRSTIIAYHAISDTWRSPMAVTLSTLSRQIGYFMSRGAVGLTFSEAESLRTEGRLPRRSVVVTFDDGFASILKAAPILLRAGYPATLFVVTDFADRLSPLRWHGLQDAPVREVTGLSWDEIRLLRDRGWEIGSHSASHPLLTELGADRVSDELTRSRQRLEAEVGRCETLAYPYGFVTPAVACAAAKAGYSAACALRDVHYPNGRFARPRFRMDNADVGVRLTAKLSWPSAYVRQTRFARRASDLRAQRSWAPQGKAY